MEKTVLEQKFKLVADTIRAYPDQLKQSWDEIGRMYIPEDYKNIQNIVFCGMGGSALGARMVDSLLTDRLRVPFEIFTEYKIPNYARRETLVITSSYSGTTEETLSCVYEAMKRNSKLFGITTGGKLAEILEKDHIPGYIFDPKYNPSKQPRMSIGYSSGAVLALLNKLGMISYSDEEIDNAVYVMNDIITELNENITEGKNLAKSYAKKIVGKIPVLIASEHIVGTAYTIKNHFNESAKTFCTLFDLPELNHHLMEGLANPRLAKKILYFIFFNSKLYTERVQKRYPLTAEVVEKNNIDYSIYWLRSDSKIAQVFESLVFGSFVVYFLTREYDIDPTKIPWVDYFKEKLTGK